MIIRHATIQDIPGLERLLSQVLDVHHAGRPDLFKPHARKYTTAQLQQLLADPSRPIFVAVAEAAAPGEIMGYAFCEHQQHIDDNILTDIKTLYIDDLCVDELQRGKHVGSALYQHVLHYARQQGFYNVTLNVWALNEGAHRFYERMGLAPQKYGLEVIL